MKKSPSKLFPTLILLWICFAFLIIVKYITFSLNDPLQTSPTLLKQQIDFSQSQSYDRLNPDESIKLGFKATFNYLGSIAIRFDNHQEIKPGRILFRIREKGTENWYYSHEYNLNQINPDYFFSIGFPIIPNSQAKIYEIELRPVDVSSKTISLHRNSPFFRAQYSYTELLKTKNAHSFLIFFTAKIMEFSQNVRIKPTFFLFIGISLGVIFLNKNLKYVTKISKRFMRLVLSLPSSRSFSEKVFMLILFLVTLFINVHFARIDVDPHHDGILFKPALDVSEGHILFRDSFTQYGALTTFIQALALTIFGQKLIVIKLLTAFIYGLISLLLYIIFRRFLPKWLTFLSVLIWIFMSPDFMVTFLPWSSVYALFFQLCTMLMLLKQKETDQHKFLIATGIFASLTMWCRQPVGIFTLVGILAYELFLYYRNVQTIKKCVVNILYQLLGFGFISILFLTYLVLTDSVTDWIKQSFIFAYYWSQNIQPQVDRLTLLLQSLFPGGLILISIWSLYPLSILFFLVFQPNIHNNIRLTGILFVALSSWLQYFPMADIRHLYWAATPMMPIFTYALYVLIRRFTEEKKRGLFSKKPILLTSILIILLHTPDIIVRIQSGLYKTSKTRVKIEEQSVLAGMFVPPEEVQTYKAIESALDAYLTKSPEKIVISDSANGLYSALDPRVINAHPSYVNWGLISQTIYPKYRSNINEIIQKNKFMVISDKPTSPNSHYCQINFNLLQMNPIVYLFQACEEKPTLRKK